MQVTKEELDPCTIKFDIEVEPETVSEAFKRSFRKVAKRIRIPGFRPGAAPDHLVKPFVSDSEVKQEAAQMLIIDATTQAIKEHGIDEYEMPRFDVGEKIEANEPFKFTATIPLPPRVELGEYKGLKAQRNLVAASAEEVDHGLEDIRRQFTTHDPVSDRGAQAGDQAVVQITPKEGEDAKPARFMIVVGSTFGEMDQAISGLKPNEPKTATLNFPEEFQHEGLAGKMAEVEIEIQELYAPVVPEIDEEMAKKLNTESVEALKDKVAAAIVGEKERMEARRVENELIQQARNNASVSLPSTLIADEAKAQLENFERDLQERGFTIADYLAANGLEQAQLEAEIRTDAQRRLENTFVLVEIARQEKIGVTEAELDAEIQILAQREGLADAEIKKLKREPEVRKRVRSDILMRKVARFLLDSAEIAETEGGTQSDGA